MKTSRAFTLIELLTVICIIAILMALVINVAGMVQTKASRDRASAEIAALSAAMESYKADNGIYPMDEELTDKVDPLSPTTPDSKASLFLYKQLSGDDADASPDFTRTGDERQNPVYFEFETKKGMVKLSSSKKVEGLTDPWGTYYGYSTIYAAALQKSAVDNTPVPANHKGFNPTFDLWSTANDTSGNTEKWVKNW